MMILLIKVTKVLFRAANKANDRMSETEAMALALKSMCQ